MFCKNKFNGKIKLKHDWNKKIQKYPYFDFIKIQVIREFRKCTRCGKEKITIVNLDKGNYANIVFREELWEDIK